MTSLRSPASLYRYFIDCEDERHNAVPQPYSATHYAGFDKPSAQAAHQRTDTRGQAKSTLCGHTRISKNVLWSALTAFLFLLLCLC